MEKTVEFGSRPGLGYSIRGMIETITFNILTPKEKEDARLTAICSYWELTQYGHIMNELNCSYTEAKREYFKRKKNGSNGKDGSYQTN